MEIQNSKVLYCLSPVDRFSDLPWPILDDILGRIPIKDAVRTSILSRQWKEKWVNLSKLVFDDSCMSDRGNVDLLVNLMYRVMLSHCGQIDSFKLSTSNKPEFSDFDNWIWFLSRNGTKQLTLEYPYRAYGVAYKMPSCLFTCQQLTHLHIMNSLLEPPNTFHGFRNLVHLQLKGYVNETEVLSSLIHNCPVLERLVLTNFQNLAPFNIQALKLKHLFMEGRLVLPIVLEDCPALAEISFLGTSYFTFDEYQVQERICHLIKDLSRLTSLKSLKISNWFLTYLALWDKSALSYKSSNHFTVLELNEIYLGDLKCALKILTFFSSLQKLYISVDHIQFFEVDFVALKGRTLLSCSLNQLHTVEIRLSCGNGRREDRYKAELEFIKFVLSRSPVLKKMTIVSNDNNIISQTTLMRELLSLDRASVAARIAFLTPLN